MLAAYALNSPSSSTTLCFSHPTINFRSKIALVLCLQRFDTRNSHGGVVENRALLVEFHLASWLRAWPLLCPENAQLVVAECSGLWCISAGGQSGVWRIKCCRIWRRSCCGGAWIGVDQALASCGEWCGLPNPDCRQCAFPACYAYQNSANTEQKRSLTWSLWLVGLSTM